MATPAQTAAVAKYIKNHTRRFTIQFHKDNEADVIEHLEAQENVTQYIKGLIRADMEAKK
ncbi:hypothetical protein [Adlercreutzia muris]|jgi:hypothetical protein|uniref:Uncharacterized protein n=1 Tax=Adlercreutzia muris TaxID=1796610 RepID=A0A7C8FYR0_9ACTN|nr:hypothetical protein [Adlercreutzia muris]KAB1642798.1 hypothetical protein F8D48_09230 [Adlercreutzia muris]MCR2027433.1 hypothetical protein [Adlercreutzia muris]